MSRAVTKWYNTLNGGVFNSVNNTYTFECTLRNTTYQLVVDDLDFWYELQKYADWNIISYDSEKDDSELERFMKKFTKFMKKNKHRFNRMWYALFAEYDPTENVFEYENETNEKTGTIDHKGGMIVTYVNGKVMTRVKGQQSDTYTDNSSTTTNYATAFDTSSELEKDKSVKSGGYTLQHGSGTDTDTASGSDTSTKSGKDTDEFNTLDTRNFNKHGNIGVMKTQDMINAEILLRRKDIISELIKDFVGDSGFLHITIGNSLDFDTEENNLWL